MPSTSWKSILNKASVGDMNYFRKVCQLGLRNFSTNIKNLTDPGDIVKGIQTEMRAYQNFQMIGPHKVKEFLGTKRMHSLLSYMDNPHQSLKVVHIAGSKGKGSTAMFLAQILAASGTNVGLYLSPFCLSIHDAIRTSSSQIAITPSGQRQDYLSFVDAALLRDSYLKFKQGADLLKQHRQEDPTFFEGLTAMAFQCFKDAHLDLAVVEVGLGGQDDATNVFSEQQSILQIITQIQLEHQVVLGQGYEKIAAHKVGIIQGSSQTIVQPQISDAAMYVIEEQIKLTRSKPYFLVEDQRVKLSGLPYINQVQGDKREAGDNQEQGGPISDYSKQQEILNKNLAQQNVDIKVPKLDKVDEIEGQAKCKLLGKSQTMSIQIAIVASQILAQHDDLKDKIKLSNSTVINGIDAAYLPGRIQVLKFKDPQVDMSKIQKGGAKYLVLDGSHTARSTNDMVDTILQLFPNNPVGLVVTMLNDKSVHQMMDQLVRLNPKVAVFTEVNQSGDSERALAPGTLIAYWQQAFQKHRRIQAEQNKQVTRVREMIQANVYGSLERVKGELTGHEGQGVVCVVGSLYAANYALQQVNQRNLLAE